MPAAKAHQEPRIFFLNEAHQLSSDEKTGGGGLPKFEGILWASKGRKISQSLSSAVQSVASSKDPLKTRRFFLMAQPVDAVKKRREDRSGALKEIYQEIPEYGGSQGKLFDRLGLDLLQVTPEGQAVVHAEPESVAKLQSVAGRLAEVGPLEQSRWATIDSFETVPLRLRVDAEWLSQLNRETLNDIVIELQPVLTRLEADLVLRTIADILTQTNGGKLTGTGTDFSGRHWFRGTALRASVRAIAKDFYSVQAIHSPLYSLAAAKNRPHSLPKPTQASDPRPLPSADSLPVVAVVDLGIPKDHRQLRAFRRGQYYPADAPSSPVGDHASFVASRIVFGDHDTSDNLLASSGHCNYYDVMVGEYPGPGGRANQINDKIVISAMMGVRSAAEEVRVFNLSFGDTRPLDGFNPIDRAQKRLDLQDLDNFVFATDTIVVVAAGNSQPGVIPDPGYPRHLTDCRWYLGPWACGFNTLVCGAYVSRLSASGLARTRGWPSPFTRFGPGLCDSPVPSFGAPGGNANPTFHRTPGLGVWGLSGSGLAEDRCGSSQAAPILSREAALTLAQLQRYCVTGTVPFGVLARAFLTLTASPSVNDPSIQELVQRTLGFGHPSVRQLVTPSAGSAIVLWQGYIESQKDVVRVQIPVPLNWLRDATEPSLRIVVCADPPVNEAAHSVWACRRIVPRLRVHPDARALSAPRGDHPTFPVINRQYKLERHKPGGDTPAQDNFWMLELSYDEVAPYPPGMEFTPRQRVAFAAELRDLSATPLDPQQAMQAIPGVELMVHLSTQRAPIRSPIVLRTR